MATAVRDLNRQELLEELRALPGFDEAFRQIEPGRKDGTMIAWLQDGTWVEMTIVPRAGGRVRLVLRSITRAEALQLYRSE